MKAGLKGFRKQVRMPIHPSNETQTSIPIQVADLSIAFCYGCHKHSVWVYGEMVFPSLSSAPLPANNMPEEILTIYTEARDIFDKSPKGAAALLRLALQKLCVLLGYRGNNLNDDIGAMVKDGMPQQIQKAFDTIRFVGNDAVHPPGRIILEDNHKIALSLFKLLNIIVDQMITLPSEVDDLYAILPQSVKDQIIRRDS